MIKVSQTINNVTTYAVEIVRIKQDTRNKTYNDNHNQGKIQKKYGRISSWQSQKRLKLEILRELEAPIGSRAMLW